MGNKYKQEKLKCNLESSPKNITTGNKADVVSTFPKKEKFNNKNLISKTPLCKYTKGSDMILEKKALNHLEKLDKFNKNDKTLSNTSKRSAHTTYCLYIFLSLIILSVGSTPPVLSLRMLAVTDNFQKILGIAGICSATFVILFITLVSLLTPSWFNVSKCLRLNKGKEKN